MRLVPFAQIFAAVLIATSLVTTSLSHAADPNSLYITPGSSQMNLNTSFTVNVRSYASTDQANGTVKGSLSYPSNLLQVQNISTSGGAYGTNPVSGQSPGSISFNGNRSPAPSGTSQLFAVTFLARGAGTASVSFTNDSVVNNVSTTYSSGSFTITDPNPKPVTSSPAPTRQATPSPKPVVIVTTPPSSQTYTSDSVDIPQASPDPTGTVDSVDINNLFSSATITWKVTIANATSKFVYGSTSTALDKEATVQKKSDGTFTTTINGLEPGKHYFFTITGSAAGAASGSYSNTIITKGFPVTISVEENDIPARNAQVQIGGRTYSTGSNGKTTVGLAAGSYAGSITTDTATLNINLTVAAKAIPAEGGSPESQSFGYKLKSSPLEQGPGTTTSVVTFVGALIGGIAVLTVGFLIYINVRKKRYDTEDKFTRTASSTTVVIDDGYMWQNKAQGGPPQNDDSPTPLIPSAGYNSSVSLNEEEPLDMFEKARLTTPASPSIESQQNAGQQSPNGPRSTTP